MSTPLHLGLAGARGQMGRAVSTVLEGRSDVMVAARFDRDARPDLGCCDVVIDFTSAEASTALAVHVAEHGAPALVIGSTGFSPEEDAAVARAAERISVVKAGNFSLGVNVLIGLVELAAARLDAGAWDAEIVEAHHRRKVDAPSGTALMLGEAVAAGRGVDLSAVRAALRDGTEGGRAPASVGFSAVRAGGIVGEHQVLFAAEDEILTFSHSARDRTLFARGAVVAALWVRGRAPGLYDMQDVLGFR